MTQSAVDLFRERKERIHKICGVNDLFADIPTDLSTIQALTFEYIKFNMDYCGKELLDLPNITPNGIILPKKENLRAYEKIQFEVGNKLEEICLVEHIQLIHLPINVRVVNNLTDIYNKRKKSSTKWHSDIWADEPSSSIMVFLPIYGINDINISCKEPHPDIYPDYIRPLENYDEGQELVIKSDNVEFFIKENCVNIMDSYTLHKTEYLKPNSYRVSLDFRFISKYHCASDIGVSKRLKHYIDVNEWMDVGLDSIIETNKSIFDDFSTVVDNYPQEYWTKKCK